MIIWPKRNSLRVSERQHEATVAARPPREPLRDPKILSMISSLSLPKCQTTPGELTRQEWKELQKTDRQKALLQSVFGRAKTNKKWCVWKYLPFSCLLLSCDIISHVGHQSCSELMTHPAHESFSSFPPNLNKACWGCSCSAAAGARLCRSPGGFASTATLISACGTDSCEAGPGSG